MEGKVKYLTDRIENYDVEERGKKANLIPALLGIPIPFYGEGQTDGNFNILNFDIL